ncbi:MAG: ATP-dependent protease ATPase subunit HslU [Candidatus Eremiobacterota bacterium]
MEEMLTPSQIVKELDRYIIGQDKAKKAVAIALRNRYRRSRLSDDLRDEVIPKNILMIGPTGVGKTEIARRLARLAEAPFLKVEATKYTEVGYVGRDVESMVRDLVEISIRMAENQKMKLMEGKAEELAVDRIVDILRPAPLSDRKMQNPFAALLGGATEPEEEQEEDEAQKERLKESKARLKEKILQGEFDDKYIEIEVEDTAPSMIEVFSGTGLEEMGVNFQDILGGVFPKKKKKRKLPIKEARKILAQDEAKKFIDKDEMRRVSIEKVEQSGIIFIDELDKIAGREKGHGPDVSREGVQRDILPILEGSTIMTKYGPVKTNHILFIAAGAFHVSKPSDLIPELQGRFPIRVELENLSQDDFLRILTEPQNALIKQYKALLETEGIDINFTDDALGEIAHLASVVNERTENIGARRLHTVMEKLLEELLFNAPDIENKDVNIDCIYVTDKLSDIVKSEDLSRYIL